MRCIPTDDKKVCVWLSEWRKNKSIIFKAAQQRRIQFKVTGTLFVCEVKWTTEEFFFDSNIILGEIQNGNGKKRTVE